MITFLLIFIVSSIIFLLLLGLYKVKLEERILAKENIQHTLAPLQQLDNSLSVKGSKALIKPKTKDDKPKTQKLEIQLERANLLITPAEFMTVSFGLLCGVLVVLWVTTGNGLLSLLCGGLAYLLPVGFLQLKIWTRMKKADNEFPNILDAVVNCFKTGYGFNRSLQVVANNYSDPWGTEFGKLAVELNLGHSLLDVMSNLKKRIPSVDVELFASAILIQKETGGNLAEILMILAKTCRERQKLLRKVSSLTAQGKLSAGTVSVVPLLIMWIMNSVMHEQVVAFLTNPIGMLLMILAGIWMLCGIAVLFKLVQLEV